MVAFLATPLLCCDKATTKGPDICPAIKWDSRSFRKLDESSMKDLLTDKEWIYQYSMHEDSCFLVKGDRYLPIRYVFRGCPADSLPETLRAKSLDPFSGVCYKTYGDSTQDNGSNLIESNFAVIRKFDDLGIFNIVYYGIYTNGEIYVTKVNADTLVIRDSYYFAKDRSSLVSEHIYVARHFQSLAPTGWQIAKPIFLRSPLTTSNASVTPNTR